MREIGGPPANEHAPPIAHPGAPISDKARPVLGAQPAPPGTMPLRLVGTEEEVQAGGVSPTVLRFEDDPSSLHYAVNQLLDMDAPNTMLQVSLNTLANILYYFDNQGQRYFGN